MKSPKKLWIDYKTPTPAKWRKLGDFALLMLVTLQSIIAAAPEEVLSTKESYWIGVSLTLLVVGFKFWTNTHTDENKSV